MARLTSLINFRGTLNGVTNVQSRAYGEHPRAARGTKSTVVVNDAFKRSSGAQALANGYAKIIKDAIDPFRINFRDGTLWPRLLSHFRAQLKKSEGVSFQSLERFSIYKSYPLERLIRARTEVSFLHPSQITVSIHLEGRPEFKNVKQATGYQLSVLAIFVNGDLKTSETAFATLPVCSLRGTQPIHTTEFAIPDEVESVLICLKIEGYENGDPLNFLKSTGMSIVKVVAVGR